MRGGSKLHWDMLLARIEIYVLLGVAVLLAAAYIVQRVVG